MICTVIRTYFISIFCVLLASANLLSQHSAISLEKLVNEAELVIEGKVVDQQPFWNPQGTMIYTSNTVEVYKVFKGNLLGSLVEIITDGGTIGNKRVVSTSAMHTAIGETGIFHCYASPITYAGAKTSALYLMEGEAQGLIRYDLTHRTAHSCTDIYPTITQLHAAIHSIAGQQHIALKTEDYSQNYYQTRGGMGVTGFSPTNLNGGIGDVLTITGVGFGNVQGGGKVRFTNAQGGGLLLDVEPLASQYLTWSDTMIQVEVPSYNAAGTGGNAATGPIEVVNDQNQSVQTLNNLVINFSRNNAESGGVAYQQDMVDHNGSGGYTLLFSIPSMGNAYGAKEAFYRALESWQCATDVNIDIGIPTMQSTNGYDAYNLVKFDSLPGGLLSTALMFFANCGGEWYLDGVDIRFNSNVNWNYQGTPAANEADFESSAAYMIGLAHLLEPVLDINSVMHYAEALGAMGRDLAWNDTLGGNYIMAQALTPNGCGPGVMTAIANCEVDAANDAAMEALVYPINNFCAGNLAVKVKIRNPGVNDLTSAQVNWSVDGNVQTPFNWTGNLVQYQTSQLIDVGSYSFTAGSHVVKVWTTLPNGLADTDLLNDTIATTLLINNCSALDAELASIDSPIANQCGGSSPVAVTLANPGSDTIYGTTITWGVNGNVQPPFLWLGILPPGMQQDSVVIGFYSFNDDDSLSIQVIDVNGIVDNNAVNNDQFFIYTTNRLSGVYTVGGVSPDFTNLDAACDAIDDYGICGPVTMNIRPGVYTGGNNEIHFTNWVDGVGPNSWITFQSESMDSTTVTLDGSYAVDLTPAEYVHIRHLTLAFSDTSASAYNTVFLHSSHHVIISNCDIQATSSFLNGPRRGIGIGFGCDSITITNNLIHGGAMGIFFAQNQGGQGHALIEHNEIYDNEEACIKMRNPGTAVIQSNKMYNTDITQSVFGVYVEQRAGAVPAEIEIRRNEINLQQGVGIYINETAALPSISTTIANNMIAIEAASDTSIGIKVLSTDQIDVEYNTVRVQSSNPTWGIPFFYRETAVSNDVSVQNNIFYNEGTNVAVRFESINGTDSLFNHATLFDYNDYYTTGPNLGRHQAQFATNIAAWRLLAGTDDHSISVQPTFVQPNDFHLLNTPANYPLLGTGNTTGTNNDFDGEPRNSSPDMGADEIVTIQYDVEPIEPATSFIHCDTLGLWVKIRNLGHETINSLEIHSEVNGVLQPVCLWSGDVAVYDTTAAILYRVFAYDHDSTYTCKIWTQLPNNGADINITNDTIYHTFNIPASSLSIGNDTTLCLGESLALVANPSAFVSYQWSTGAIDSAIVVIASGPYWVEVVDTTGCILLDTMTFSNFPVLPLELGNDTALCHGQTLTLAASGFDTYAWSTTATDSSIVVNTWGTYWLNATDVYGCIETDTISVYYPAAGFTRDTILCEGATLNLQTVPDVSSHQWSTGHTTPSILISTAGTYWLDAIDSVGCAISDTIDIVYTPVAANFLGNDTVICVGDVLTMNPGSWHQSYSWSVGITDSVFATSTVGTYWVDIIDSNGCLQSDTITFSNHFVVSPVIWQNGDTLFTTNTIATTYQWYYWGTIIPGANSYYHIATLPGDYSVEVVDTNGCTLGSSTVSVIITGTEQFDNGFTVDISPNPNTGQFTLVIVSPESHDYELLLTDIMGRKIYQFKLDNVLGAHQHDIRLDNCAPGVYFLKIRGAGGNKSVGIVLE